ncbi:Putative transposon Tn552 DNA-invertase bin3 [Jeotgalicoccus saudimassiliensis]|uniref:Putative transposon Tn552 DNA-invertase bin3 n=1 Tax=Jeotgalicoccus saudimassiliensis TaxID=1461582 RepID=A0A078M9D4_9STAP|nr:recombinase family protein [Jeotgalicoccus saudimassiliensis]CEA02880.1 Putative transposon Tn552 DNA-invertase bin3 [Jeotgalicoccus saudimassiliensis]
MIYGYARVSNKDQNLARQIEALKNEGCENIFKEMVSGANLNRPALQNLLEELNAGDIVIVHSLDRISRSTVDLLNLVEMMKKKGVFMKSLQDAWFDMTDDNPFSDFLLTIMSGLSEYERKMIKSRQREGIIQAKKEGKYKGRIRKYTENHVGMNHAIELYHSGAKTVKEICDITKVSKSALYRELKRREGDILVKS